MALKNHNKLWEPNDVEEVLSLYVDDRRNYTFIARKMDRTRGGVQAIVSGYNQYAKKGIKAGYVSDENFAIIKRFADARKLSRKNATSIVKHTEAVTQTPVAPETAKAEAPAETIKKIEAINAAFDTVKEAIADLVEFEVARGVAEKTKEVKAELDELREFRDKAKESNPTSFITNRLFGNKHN